MLKPTSLPSKMIFASLVLLLVGCATQPPAPPFEPARVPALPSQARASLVPTPLGCSLTCSAGLTNEREKWRNTLTGSGLPASLASAPTTR